MPMPSSTITRAADFVWRNARLIDRTRFAYHFLDGPLESVMAALRAYQNDDGGFGHALEPDLRAPHSEPAAVRAALEVLDQIDEFDIPLVTGACDFLLTIAPPDGGVPFVLPAAMDYPHAPWWQAGGASSAIVFSALIAGLLHKRGVSHAWLTRATEYCWRQVEAFDPPGYDGPRWEIPRIGTAYEARALLAFLEHVPDPRREGALDRVGRLVLDRGLVELTCQVPGEVHTPLDYARSPKSALRTLFQDDVIESHLDELTASQQPDGGWMFRWAEWNAATTLEWRGWLTVETLLLLEAYGRL